MNKLSNLDETLSSCYDQIVEVEVVDLFPLSLFLEAQGNAGRIQPHSVLEQLAHSDRLKILQPPTAKRKLDPFLGIPGAAVRPGSYLHWGIFIQFLPLFPFNKLVFIFS